MRAGVNNRGILLFSWHSRPSCARTEKERPEAMLATSTTGLTIGSSLEGRSTMAEFDVSPLGGEGNATGPFIRKDLTAQRLRELLTYDPLSGVFTWNYIVPATQGEQVRNTRFAGKVAGSRARCARNIRVDMVRYLEHRLAWLWMTGEWPKLIIDHKNGDCFDNRWSNLREATYCENSQNRRAASKNKTGFLGVSIHRNKRFISHICVRGKSEHIGCFNTAEDASKAYLARRKEIFEFQPVPRDSQGTESQNIEAYRVTGAGVLP